MAINKSVVALVGMLATAGFTTAYSTVPEFKTVVDKQYNKVMKTATWQKAEAAMTINHVSGGVACWTREDMITTVAIALNTTLGVDAFQMAMQEGICFRATKVKIDRVHNLISMGDGIDAALISIKLADGKTAWALYIVGSRGGRSGKREQNAGPRLQELPSSKASGRYERGI